MSSGILQSFPASRHAGFTLLEVLLAVFIFALIATGAYQILSIAHKNALSINTTQDRLHDISLTFELIEKDFTQIVSRAWRDSYNNSSNPPLQTDLSSNYVVRMVRGGWRNPLGSKRSNQQLVTYRLQDNNLIRIYNQNLDSLSSAEPLETLLLNNVVLVELTFFDRQNKDQAGQNAQSIRSWPPQNFIPPQKISTTGEVIQFTNYPLPIAIEVTLELADMGRISRIIPMPTGA